jgi:uncharacterized protein YabE (DUF348 family)
MSEMIISILGVIIGVILTFLLGVISHQFKEIIAQFEGMRKNISTMSESVQVLNIQIAVIIKDQDWHKKEINDLRKEITNLKKELST